MAACLSFFTLLLLSFSFLQISSTNSYSTCNNQSKNTEHALILKAFSSVSGFNSTSFITNCSSTITQIRLPSHNLSGTISWQYLKNLTHLRTLDLSHNHLKGSVPYWVFSLKSIMDINLSNNQFGGTLNFEPILNSSVFSEVQRLNLSHNKFTKLVRVSGFLNLKELDISHNDLKILPSGLGNLTKLDFLDVSNCNLSGNINPISNLYSLKYLDVSNNKLTGNFPGDFPPLTKLNFLNISLNNFSGNSVDQYHNKFGKSAFVHAGNFSVSNTVFSHNPPQNPLKKHTPIKEPPKNPHPKQRNNSNKHKKFIIFATSFGSAGVVVLVSLCIIFVIYKRKKNERRKKRWAISTPMTHHHHNQGLMKMEKSGPLEFETESGSSWVVDMRDATSAAVVMFEKPLMSLSFKDLMHATCQFGRESQLGGQGQGRCGPLYRAVLPGDLHVAVKVLESARGVDREEAVKLFEDMAKMRHPNLLNICGYCIAGKEKLVLYEFMSNGDLHSWLHELPPGKPNVDDWSTDTWEYPTDPEVTPHHQLTSPEKLNWVTRHRIALGVARGLAYLHHARCRPVVHGHLVPSNVLLSDDLEPRIADFGMRSFGENDSSVGSVEEDVFGFGLILIELLTGQSVGSEDKVNRIRKLVRNGSGAAVLDSRLKLEDDSVNGAVECLRVGYLCTAEKAEKRPTMQQVVGMLKDIHPN